MKKLLQRRQGFTLIELLIVIVIIGILSVGFAPTLLNAPKKARDGVRKGQIAGIQQAVEAFSLDNSSAYPADGAGAITCLKDTTSLGKYFQGSVLPKDPSYTGATYPTCGFAYKYIAPTVPASAAAGCYIISVKIEDSGKGNSNVADPACNATLSTAGGSGYDYYQTIVKF